MSSCRGFTRFAVTLASVDVAAGGAENYNDGEKAEHTNQSEGKVRSGEERPGFHVFVSTAFIIARAAPAGKGGLPNLGEILYGSSKVLYVITQVSYCSITSMAQQPSNSTRIVIVINNEYISPFCTFRVCP
jgi:hypothetical protein